MNGGAVTDYGDEGVTNVTSHPFGGAGGGFGLPNFGPLILAMLRARAQTSRPVEAPRPRGSLIAATAPRPMAPTAMGARAGTMGRPADPNQATAQQIALSEIIQRFNAATNPPPTRYVTGASVIPGPTLDPMRMNAYQQSLFLPKAAQEIGQGLPAPESYGGWRQRSPGEGPYSGSAAGQETARLEMELLKEQIRGREMARRGAYA